MRVALIYHLTCHHRLATQIKGLITGHHMMTTSNLKLLTFYTTETRCLLGTSTTFSVSGLHLLPSMMMNHHFKRCCIFITLLTLLLSAMPPGNSSVYNIMDPGWQKMFHCGCKQSMMSGFRILILWSIISYPTLISSLVLIMCHIKSTQLMVFITFNTSCPEIGLGSKWWVFAMVPLIWY